MMHQSRTNLGVSNTRNYQAAVATSGVHTSSPQETEPQPQPQPQKKAVLQRIRRVVPNRAGNFSHNSQKSSNSGHGFSICSSTDDGKSHLFHQQDGDEDDMSKYAFSVEDGSVAFASHRRKSFNSSYDTGSQYTLTDDDEDGAYFCEGGSVYSTEGGYNNNNNVPSQEELERIYHEMRAIRLAEEEELRRAMEASQEQLELEQQQEMQQQQQQHDPQDSNVDNYDHDEYRKLEHVSESVDSTEQSSFADLEGVNHLTPASSAAQKVQPENKKKEKNGLFRLFSQVFFGKKQSKVEKAIANANKQKGRAAAKKNKKMDQYLRASAPTFPVGIDMDSNKPRNIVHRQHLVRQISVPVIQTPQEPFSRPALLSTSQSARGFPALLTGTEVDC